MEKKSENLEFRKSSYCQGCFACVEIAFRENEVYVRNSSDSTKTTIKFNLDEWSNFIKGVKAGDFNLQ